MGHLPLWGTPSPHTSSPRRYGAMHHPAAFRARPHFQIASDAPDKHRKEPTKTIYLVASSLYASATVTLRTYLFIDERHMILVNVCSITALSRSPLRTDSADPCLCYIRASGTGRRYVCLFVLISMTAKRYVNV